MVVIKNMATIMHGIKNFLQLINDNWALIIAILGLAFGLFKKIYGFFTKSEEERIAIVKEQIRSTMLKMITDAEEDYANYVKAGEVKRSQVIKQIYADFPILARVQNQEELIAWIDEQIDDALKVLRKIIEENKIID